MGRKDKMKYKAILQILIGEFREKLNQLKDQVI
jgi:hypothetical protein